MTRHMTARQLALAHLVSATGCTNQELAVALEWQQASVRCLIASLRHEGWPISAQTANGRSKRYYLKPDQAMETESVTPTLALTTLGLVE